MPTNLELIQIGEEALVKNQAAVARLQGKLIIIARGMLAARRKYPNQRDFAVWFTSSPYEELALDWMQCSQSRCVRVLCDIADNEAEAIKVIRATGTADPDFIWQQMMKARRAARRTGREGARCEPTDNPSPSQLEGGSKSVFSLKMPMPRPRFIRSDDPMSLQIPPLTQTPLEDI